MMYLKATFCALALLVASWIGGTAVAQDATPPIERFGGEARIAPQPGLPIHLELRRSGGSVTGVISIPGAEFELVGAGGDRPIVGSFRGKGGSGNLVLRVDGDVLDGEFDLAGQPGTIIARRTLQSAEAFFRPPEQRLDLTTAQWHGDLDRLVEILAREHASPFHRVAQEQFDREVARVRAAIAGLDGVAVALEFRKLGALIGDGHTSVAMPLGRARLPVDLYWFDDGIRIVQAPTTHRHVLGAKVIAVDGVPIADLAERVRAFVAQGETEWFHRESAPNLLSDAHVLRAIGAGAGPVYAFDVESTDGRRERVDIPAVTRWDTLPSGRPLWQVGPEQGLRSERLADGSVYVNWRSYDDLDAEGAALLQSLDGSRPPRLIVDLRDNDGGDFNVGRTFVGGIRSRPWLNRKGVLYVMIGRKTFSAAMTNAVDFAQTTEAVLVGEPAGAAPNNWQEVRRFHLPNSGLTVEVSTRYYEFLPGEAELSPDLLASPEPADWGSPQDAGVRLVVTQPVP